jgi:N-dimethylarginine dimethylaminohydrolase
MNDFDRYQALLYQKEWTWDDMPFYQPGQKLDITPWHSYEYMDFYEKLKGRKIGANGIGKLKEVALTKITDAENQVYDKGRFPNAPSAAYLEAHGFRQFLDIALAQRQQEAYALALENHGVTVHWIDFGKFPVSAYGPMQGMWAAHDLLIINGGAVVPKMGRHPLSFGRGEWLSHWAQWERNIPTLLTIHGSGVCEVGATLWIAQDVYVAGLSSAYNQKGLDQLLPVVKRTANVGDLQVLTIRCPSARYFERMTGASAHVTNVLGPLDKGTLIAHLPGIDTASVLWLRNNGFKLIECDTDEQIKFWGAGVCNIQLLEPGIVVMAAEAKETIKKVRAEGIEVIEVPYSAFQQAGGGFHSSTMQIYREPGPTHFA